MEEIVTLIAAVQLLKLFGTKSQSDRAIWVWVMAELRKKITSKPASNLKIAFRGKGVAIDEWGLNRRILKGGSAGKGVQQNAVPPFGGTAFNQGIQFPQGFHPRFTKWLRPGDAPG